MSSCDFLGALGAVLVLVYIPVVRLHSLFNCWIKGKTDRRTDRQTDRDGCLSKSHLAAAVVFHSDLISTEAVVDLVDDVFVNAAVVVVLPAGSNRRPVPVPGVRTGARVRVLKTRPRAQRAAF